MPITPLAEQYLTAFTDGGHAFPGGIAYLDALRRAALDDTPESLGRIDTLLDEIRSTDAPAFPAFIAQSANQNFLYFLAFYVGRTIERNNPGARIEWLEHKELAARNPGLAELWPYRFETSVICVVAGGHARQGEFLPLSPIVIRLFEGPDEKSVWFSADAYIAATAPQASPAQYFDGQLVQKGDALLYQRGLFPGRVDDIVNGPHDGESLVIDDGDPAGGKRVVEAVKDSLVLVQRNTRDFKAACLTFLERCAADPVRQEPYGAAHAQFALGNLYWNGLLVDRHVRKAVQLWQSSAALGYTPAEHEVGTLFYQGNAVAADPVKALQFFNRAAAKGFARSQSSLGRMYEDGGRDLATAADWYRKAADQDDEMGLCNLAVLLLQGRGVPQDSAQGIALLTRAAAQGSAFANYRLGMCYETGEGVPQDYAACVRYYVLATEQGYGAAINNLADKYEHGLGVTQDLAKAVSLYSVAADMNIIAAWYSLGCMYQEGRGVAQDRRQARSWLEKAAAYRFKDSVERLVALG